ncbi:MAG: DUF4139 domain-containing protein [Gammaproteobacteria bacterium]
MDPISPRLLLAIAACGCSAAAAAQQGVAPATSLTIYSTVRPRAIPPALYRSGQVLQPGAVPGYAVVSQNRRILLPGRVSTVRLAGVAAAIDPTTVRFKPLSDPRTRVLEQGYQFDLASGATLLRRYLGRSITVDRARGDHQRAVTGTLLSTRDGLVLRDEHGNVLLLHSYGDIHFPALPNGLVARPTLVWRLQTDRPGEQQAQVSYQTRGMTWWADYNLLYHPGENANACSLDVGAWVSIVNQSGVGYHQATLKLVAGDVHRANQSDSRIGPRVALEAAKAPNQAGFREKPLFEYHLYTLDRRVDLPDNTSKQMQLFPPIGGVPCRTTLVYEGLTPGYGGGSARPITERNYGLRASRKVDLYLHFRNDKQHRLGIPLPAGRVRVSKQDPADGSPVFIGEDTIDHTPKDEDVRINLGSAFDVVGERKQLAFTVDKAGRSMEERIEIKLRNHKSKPVEVQVKENLYRWNNWKIVQASHEYRKADAHTIVFPVRVGKDQEATVRYTVRYTW